MSAKIHTIAPALISADMGPEQASMPPPLPLRSAISVVLRYCTLMAYSTPLPSLLRSAISVELRYSDGAPPTEAVTGAVCPGQTYSLQVSEHGITHGVFSLPATPSD